LQTAFAPQGFGEQGAIGSIGVFTNKGKKINTFQKKFCDYKLHETGTH
jgi:hypothetical protein